jgi:hypothetical protein
MLHRSGPGDNRVTAPGIGTISANGNADHGGEGMKPFITTGYNRDSNGAWIESGHLLSCGGNNQIKPLLTLQEAAQALGISADQAYRERHHIPWMLNMLEIEATK